MTATIQSSCIQHSPGQRLLSASGRFAPALAALFVAAPIFFVVASLGFGDTATQSHLWATMGPKYLLETLLLCLLVGVTSSIIGVAAASLIALTDFPGRTVLSIALVLPFAVPAYITAYTYGDFFGPFGGLRQLAGSNTAIPEIRSLPGAALVLALAVYPYVYLAVRASFEGRSGAYMEAARTLGMPPVDFVWKVLLPAGRAAFAGGLALALMETAADFGVADYFGVPTLSVGIFRTWYGLGDLTGASQLAAGLFMLALLLVLLEERARRGLGAESARAHRRTTRLKLSPISGIFAAVFCTVPVVLGFGLPVIVLLGKLFGSSVNIRWPEFTSALSNTSAIAIVSTLVTILVATILAYVARRSTTRITKITIRTATLGYALPGAVMAIGVLAFASKTGANFGVTVLGLVLLIYAYTARFLTAGFNSIAAGLGQIHPLSDEAARTLGAQPAAIVARIHWPIARSSIAAGALIVLIDIARELPATLILRPFNFETLATQVYRLASDERLAEAAPTALILIGLSLAPVVLLNTFVRRSTPGGESRQ